MTKKILNNQKKKLSILFIGTQMATGGAQTGLLDQARWFQTQGCDVTVAFFYDKEGLHETWKQRFGFPIHNLQAYTRGAGLLSRSLHFLRGLYSLWVLLRHARFDVVETFTHDSNLLGLPLAWLARVPVRLATHRGKIEGFPGWRQKLHSGLVNVGIAHTLIAVSEQTRKLAMDEGVAAEKITVILNGVTPLDTASVNRAQARKNLGLSDHDVFLLSVGRLTYQKGHEFLIQAIPGIVSRYPNVKAAICGDGPLRPQLEAQIVKLGLSNHVQLLGMLSDVSPALVSADIFVLPSRWEGLSRALMEAMAEGIPVVTTDVDGIKDLIIDGVYGLLVPPEDSERLEKSILQLLDNPEIMTRIGVAARAHVLQIHSTVSMCQKYYDLVQTLLKSR